MSEPKRALIELSRSLAEQGGLLAPYLRELDRDDSQAAPLGQLAASGPRAADDPAAYALVVEAIREGYLLHYGRPRIFHDTDPDLALLAGDYMYALGLDRLAQIGDATAVALLGDLISDVALCHSQGLEHCVSSLWLAMVTAVACGESDEIIAANAALRGLESASDQQLWHAAETTAKASGIESDLLFAAKAIDFPAVN